jgi:NADPH-dependent 2,4-dienoyl-CoA reductase/sulfur reductase-like enzyme
VVGSSVAGTAACVGLRAAGYAGEVVLIGDERHVPYDRPPLSKQLLYGTVEAADIVLPNAEKLEALGVERLAGVAATGLDALRGEVHLQDRRPLAFDGLLIATGSTARRLPGQVQAAGLHVLRTLDDALALRDDLRYGRHVAIIGGGCIGLEIASAARSLGLSAVVLEATPAPMARILGLGPGRLFTALHEEHGIEVRCNVKVGGLRVTDGRVTGVDVVGGPPVVADIVVVGIGASPATGWLQDSGLAIDDGVVCDSFLRARPGIYAAGDVARWNHPLFGMLRVEHWTTAGDHARIASWNLHAELEDRVDELRAASEVPYFWSDQHGVKIQIAGLPAEAERVHQVTDGKRIGILFGAGGQLIAAMTWSWPALIARLRAAIAAQTAWDAAVAAVS